MMRKIAKPTYFNLFDEAHVDTEDELVAGENNYVEIKCLPMEDDEEQKARLEEQKKNNKAPEDVPASADDEPSFCRFCWDSTSVVMNPLLSVCKCSGGVGFVHYVCLKYWLKTKMTENKTHTSKTIYWRIFGCEICHQIYPYVFKANGRRYSLIEVERPSSDFIMLESLTLEKSTSRMIQILKPHMRVHTFKLGRGLDQDLRINDISVSRYHAQIKFIENRFILEDNLSKFGTLVLIKRGLDIYPGQSRSVQVGRSLVNFHLSFQEPRQVKTSEILYAPKAQIEMILSQKDQLKVRDQVNQLYASLRENELHQKRQKMIHMQLQENNFDINHIYLQRRQLNIQDEDHINYQSDEEEQKCHE